MSSGSAPRPQYIVVIDDLHPVPLRKPESTIATEVRDADGCLV
jgi:hypothetical protein